MMACQDRNISVEGRNVHYTFRQGTMGKSKPVLLLHGFTEAVFVWEELAAFLCERGYDVLCLDMAGHGKTDMFGDVHGMDLQAGIAKRVLEAENIAQAVVIGHSMGGYVAAAFGCLYPQMVKGIGFFHSHPGPDSPQAAENRRRSLELLRAGRISFVTDTMHTLFAPGTEEQYAEQIGFLRENAKKMGAQAIAAAQAGMLERESRLSVYELDVPFLFIIGTQDERMDKAKLMAQTLLPKEACVQLLPVGHMGMYERPHQTMRFVAGYLDTVVW
ncbi:MAG: alpha/beta hydrolase [Bacteroides sp.]|nr:alpha/beta hydrolase [Bacteroides sp.]MCM1084745.1 alpha/beta hydrolase [Bacteroides sp.]